MNALPTSQGLVLRVRSRTYALPLEAVIETLRPLPIEAAAGAPPFVRGVAIVRGAPTPVVDLGALVGGAAGEPARWVTLRLGGRTVALAVDEVVGVRALAGAEAGLPPLLAAAAPEALQALQALDAELLWILRAGWSLPDRLWDGPTS